MTSLDAAWHLRAELSRLLYCLSRFLQRQRQRGRTPAADLVRGFVIEEGEAEGLLHELAAVWGESPPSPPGRTSPPSRPDAEINFQLDAAQRQGAYLPLRHAARAFDLRPGEYDAVLLALAGEMDARFGRLYAYLNDHVGQTRPTVGLVVGLAAWEADRRELPSPLALTARPLVADGLLDLEGDVPLPGRALRLPDEIARRLTTNQQLDPATEGVALHPPEMGLLDRLCLVEPLRQALKVWVQDAKKYHQQAPALIFAGWPGSGRATAAHAAASAAGLALVAVDLDVALLEERLRLARRESRWYKAGLLLKTNNSQIDWRAVWRQLQEVGRTVFLALPGEAAQEASQMAPGQPGLVFLPEPPLELRGHLWRSLLPPEANLDPAAIDALATGFRFNPGRISQTIRRARSDLILMPPGKRHLTGEVLHQAARAIGAALMGPLAQKLPCSYEPQDLVVPTKVQEELDLALAWVRGQTQVLTVWGFQRRVPMGQGLKALFAGPSGTGKTMAAQVLARQLRLDLYRVDLSQVVSKFIGETEKNLAQVFEEAHRSGASLFFDEADALFGRRSEVKDAHDRYANIEIGYLLQRLEEHDGVVILATNRRQDLDEAFVRRFDVMLEFPMPSEVHRLKIWEGMFPPEAEREADLDLKLLAKKFELSGGEIRNIVLAAAYLAADAGRPIAMSHLKRALRRELIKSGRVVAETELRLLDSDNSKRQSRSE